MNSLPFRTAMEATRIVARQGSATAAAGSANNKKLQQSSAASLLSTFWPVAVYSLGFFILFLVLRRIFPRQYVPRTFVSSLPTRARTKELPKGFVNWIKAYFNADNVQILNAQETLDGYLFLRLLRMSVISCAVGVIITWPILLPINATGAGNETQLNILTFSNVASPSNPNSYNRYYAHVICAYLYFSYIIYMITRESLYLINLRQAYLVSPVYANRISSRTVLFCSVPPAWLKEDVLRNLFGSKLVRNIWIPLETNELETQVDERDDMLMNLEMAEIDLIKRANKARRETIKKNDLPQVENAAEEEKDESGSVAARWIKPTDRPTHRLGFLGLWGEKVDTINWCRQQLISKIPQVEKMQKEQRAFIGKTRRAAFVEFTSLPEAQNAYQALTHHTPLNMAPRYTGMYPEEIIWYNLRLRWWERILRVTASYTIVIAVIIFWSFPIAFIGSISKLKYLAALPGLRWLDFLNHLGYFSGILTGLLPVVLLSVLMALLPIFLRLMARLAGDPTRSAVEYTVQSTYFWFYVIQGFLITTLSSGAVEAAVQIFNDPASVVNLLAESLPASSNFYLSFFVLQGLGVVSQVLLSLVNLALFHILGHFLDSTPRKIFSRWMKLSKPQLGSFYPIYTTLFIMAISYSCIAPLVVGFGALGLTFFYLAYRYQFLYVYNVRYDTKGLMYGRALQQLFVGLYLAQGCLIGLFAINLGNSSKLLGPLILMIIFLVFTALYHYSLNSALAPLLQYLPKTLESEEQRLLREEEEKAESSDVEDMEANGHEKKENGHGLTNSGLDRSQTSRTMDSMRSTLGGGAKAEPSFLAQFFRPDKYSNYYNLRRLVPRATVHIDYSEKEEKEAYFHPYVTKDPDLLWIPRDEAGVSKQEIQHTSDVTPITDEGAVLDENGKIQWNYEDVDSVPIYQPKVYY